MRLRGPREEVPWAALFSAATILFLYRLVAAFVVSYPVARAIGAFGPTNAADGDRSLFVAGGFALLETLRLGGRAIGASLEAASGVGIVLSLIGLVPLAMAIAILSAEAAKMSLPATRALSRFAALAALFGLVVLAQAALGTTTVLAVSSAHDVFGATLNERSADLSTLAVGSVGVVAMTLVGILHDLARVTVVRDESPVLRAMTLSLRVFALRPGRTTLFWLASASASLGAVAVAAWLTGVIDVSRHGAWRVAAVFVAHQLTMFWVSGCRVAWLAHAVRAVPSNAAALP